MFYSRVGCCFLIYIEILYQFQIFSEMSSAVVSVGAALFFFQQLAGINAVVYYSTSVFRSAGIASDVAASALVGAANVFGKYVESCYFSSICTCMNFCN